LDHFDGPVLITGPAGFGKTTFCRWNAIRDANRLVAKEASVLPVYRALHPLSKTQLGTFEDAFFPNDELKKLIRQEAAGQAPFTRIRLYLDGLDEVTSAARQEEIVGLAAQAAKDWTFVQVVLTARDHVNGAALRWLPRIHLQKLTAPKIRMLSERWLGNERVDGFFARLNESGSLPDLMGVPLLATLILAVYRKTSCIPPNKTNLYSLFVELLCGGWDFYKNIQRRPAKFSTRDKEVALARLAGILQHEGKRDATDAEFRVSLKESLSFLVPDWDELLGEIVEDGLLVRVGTALTFTHLSFQEFLAARDLRDHMGNRPKQALGWFLNGGDWWREVLAFYVTLLDRPADTDEWLIARALASTSTMPDLVERVAYLRAAVQAAFPAYKETSGSRREFGRLESRAAARKREGVRESAGARSGRANCVSSA
jgi:predicted NACHT family NTPase